MEIDCLSPSRRGRQKFSMNDPQKRWCLSFSWTRKKEGLAVGLCFFSGSWMPKPVVMPISSTTLWWSWPMTSFSSPVCNVHSTSRRCSTRQMILVFVPVLVSFSLDIAGAHIMIYIYMYFEDICMHTSSYVLALAQLVPFSEIFIFVQSSITEIPLNESTVW